MKHFYLNLIGIVNNKKLISFQLRTTINGRIITISFPHFTLRPFHTMTRTEFIFHSDLNFANESFSFYAGWLLVFSFVLCFLIDVFFIFFFNCYQRPSLFQIDKPYQYALERKRLAFVYSMQPNNWELTIQCYKIFRNAQIYNTIYKIL